MFKVYLKKQRTSLLLVRVALLAREALLASEELEPVGRVTVRGTGHRTVTSPYNNATLIIIMIATPFIDSGATLIIIMIATPSGAQ